MHGRTRNNARTPAPSHLVTIVAVPPTLDSRERSLLPLCCGKNRTNREENGRQKTREREGGGKALHDTVFIKDSCSQSKGQERFIGFNFPTKSINIYDLSAPASGNDYFQNKWQAGGFVPPSMAVHSFVVKLNQQAEEENKKTPVSTHPRFPATQSSEDFICVAHNTCRHGDFHPLSLTLC